MTENTPSADKKPDPFKHILRRIHPDVLRNYGLNQAELRQAADTAIAFNLTKKFFDEYKQAPSEWRSLGYDRSSDGSANFSRETSFLFVRVEDGSIVGKETRSFSTPAAFYEALQKFHNLDPVTDAQKRSAEIAALWRGRMAGNVAPTPTDTTSPSGIRPSRPVRTIKPSS